MKRGVSISVYNNRKILAVTNRRWGGFTLPGGKVEKDELPDEAAFRELYEETGIVPNGLIYLGSSLFDNPLTDDAPFIISHYEAVIWNPRPKKMEEGTDPFWTESHNLYESKESIFAEHYKKLREMDVIKSFGGRVVMD